MTRHWTENSSKDFMFSVAMDFASELEVIMGERNISQKDLAAMMQVSEGRVSQIINNPGNLTLRLMVEWARALKMKVALVAYDDGDGENAKGPIFSTVFRQCWEALGKPVDAWQLDTALMSDKTVNNNLSAEKWSKPSTVENEKDNVVRPNCWNKQNPEVPTQLGALGS